jgi:hypothetical protein
VTDARAKIAGSVPYIKISIANERAALNVLLERRQAAIEQRDQTPPVETAVPAAHADGADGVVRSATASKRLPCPYPGMVPFGAGDAAFFYGREAETRQIARYLRHGRFLCVIGPSGSGKSSLIHAGALPKLHNGSYFKLDYWLVRELRPGDQPLHALAEALGDHPDHPARPTAWRCRADRRNHNTSAFKRGKIYLPRRASDATRIRRIRGIH